MLTCGFAQNDKNRSERWDSLIKGVETLSGHSVTRARQWDRAVPWCDRCVLRSGCGFEDFKPEDLAFMNQLKIGHGRAWAGETLLDPTSSDFPCYTLFSGWAVRCRLLPDGRRQILAVLLPGDTIGLAAALLGKSMDHVEAVTDATFCVLDTRTMRESLGVNGWGLRVARLLAFENQQLANRLAIMGACDARANVANFIYDIYVRLGLRRMTQGSSFKLPLSSRHIAEAVGLTPVHLHRVLRDLRDDNLLTIEKKTVNILDPGGIAKCSLSSVLPEVNAPLL